MAIYSGFSQLENGDFPWQNVSSPEGKVIATKQSPADQ